jgi:hypothetical protein
LLVVDAAVVCKSVPPEEALYQRKVPETEEFAVNKTVPVPQRSTLVDVGVAGIVFIVAATAARALLKQVPLSNST